MTWITGTAQNHKDLLDILDFQATQFGSCYGLAFAGVGDGTLTGLHGAGDLVCETITVAFTSATEFTVTGSVSGAQGTGTVGTMFLGIVSFTINAGATPFQAGDAFTFATAPAWERLRRVPGCTVTATQGNTGQQAVENLLDGKSALDDTRCWRVDSPVTLPQEIIFTFTEQQTITAYQLLGTSIGYLPTAWTFEVFYGGAWHVLDTQTGRPSYGMTALTTFPITTPHTGLQYKLKITAIGYSNLVSLGAVRLLRDGDSVDAAFNCCIWKAFGNDGNSEVFLGIHCFGREDADYHDWEVFSFDGFNDQSHFRDQPGSQGRLYVPLWNQEIPFWFVINGRRAFVVAKINEQYEFAYLGFIDPYLSPAQLPYPMALGGSLALGNTTPAWNSTNFRWSNAGLNHVAPTHSDPYALGGIDVLNCQLRLRGQDGTWVPLEATWTDSVGSPPSAPVGVILPYRCGLSLLDPNLDGTYALWPVMLQHPAPTTFGQLDGIFAVTGQNLTSETLIRVGAIDHIVFNNINRNDRDDYLAVALD